MLSSHSLVAASEIARRLTDQGLCLTVKANTPLASLVGQLTLPDGGSAPLTDESSDALRSLVAHLNPELDETTSETPQGWTRRDLLVSVTHGQQTLLTSLRDTLRGPIKRIVDRVEAQEDAHREQEGPTLTVVDLPEYLQSVGRLDQLERQARSSGVREGDAITLSTLRVPAQSDATVESWLSTEGRELLASRTDAPSVATLFHTFFHARSEIPLREVSLGTSHQRYVRMLHLITLYELALYLTDHPMEEVPVDLETWTRTWTHMTNVLAYLLLDVIQTHQRYRHKERLVLEVRNPELTSMNVVVFAPVAERFTQIAVVDRLLAVASEFPSKVMLSEYLLASEETGGTLSPNIEVAAMARWKRELKQRQDDTTKARRHRLIKALAEATQGEFPTIEQSEITLAYQNLEWTSDAPLWEVVGHVVFSLLPNSGGLKAFLWAMNAYHDHPPREAATRASIDYLTSWWRQQVSYDTFTQE